MTPKAYAKALQGFFAQNADAGEAQGMADYMKNRFVFFGIKAPLRKQLGKQFIKQHGLPADVEATVRELWKLPQREVHYFAQELCGKLAKKAPPERLGLYEELITTHSWWDSIDYISQHLCGVHLLVYPELKTKAVKKWVKSNNIWLMRTALLFQMPYKKQTDEKLLFDLCREMAAEEDFFVRKAIGWALRQYARTEPRRVKEFVEKTALSPLSRKEALKHF